MRLQLALNVRDLDDAIEFYSKMFDTRPAKTRPGYANFAIDQPPLKLVLFEDSSATDESTFHHLNHLGVETETADEVAVAEARLTANSVDTTGIVDTECCYAEKTETWATSPDGARWEWYVKTGDVETFENIAAEASSGAACACS